MKIFQSAIASILLILFTFPSLSLANSCHAKKIAVMNMTDQAFEIVSGDGNVIEIPANKAIRAKARMVNFYTAPCAMLRIQKAGQPQTRQVALFGADTAQPSIRIDHGGKRNQVQITANSIGGHFKIKEMIKYHGVQPYLAKLKIENS